MNFKIFAFLCVMLCTSIVLKAQTRSGPTKFEKFVELQSIVDRAAAETILKFAAKNLKAENLAITLVDLSDKERSKIASFRGGEKIYPASVVKLFYLAATHEWLETGKIKDSPELQRALKDMIVVSSNDATHFIVDVLTDTSSGAELAPAELEKFAYQRNAVNRYFAALGYENINVCQKTYCEDAYGREQQFRGPNGANRNKLTTDATARLLSEIAMGKAVTPERSRQMMELLKRDFAGESKDPDDQAHGFTGIALPPNAKLWSKAGWTSTTRHDAAYVELPSGKKIVLVVFTENFANEREIIPTVARFVLAEIAKIKR